MPRRLVPALVAALVLAVAVPARADDAAAPAPPPDYFARPSSSTMVTVRQERTRTRSQKLMIGGLGVGAAVFAGVGLYFHLDSNRIAGDLSADTPQGVRWDEALQDKYDKGQTEGTLAIVSYVLAIGLAGGTAAAILLTDPGDDLVELKVRPTAGLVTGGGGTVGAAWRW